MKKLFILLFIVLLVTGCSQANHNTKLEKSITSIVKDKEKSELNVKSLAKFEWDKAYLFTPYTSEEDMNEQLGLDFKDPSNMKSRDDIFLLVFVNGDEVVEYTEIKRHKSNLSLDGKEYLTPKDPIVMIQR